MTCITWLLLAILTLGNSLNAQSNEPSPTPPTSLTSPTKEPHFIIYPVYSPSNTEEEQEFQTQMQEILQIGAKKAFEQLGISYEIANPLKPPNPDRFKVLIEVDGKTDVLQVNRKKGSEKQYARRR